MANTSASMEVDTKPLEGAIKTATVKVTGLVKEIWEAMSQESQKFIEKQAAAMASISGERRGVAKGAAGQIPRWILGARADEVRREAGNVIKEQIRAGTGLTRERAKEIKASLAMEKSHVVAKKMNEKEWSDVYREKKKQDLHFEKEIGSKKRKEESVLAKDKEQQRKKEAAFDKDWLIAKRRNEDIHESALRENVTRSKRKKVQEDRIHRKKETDERRGHMKDELRDAVLFQSFLGATVGQLPGGQFAQAAAYGFVSTSQRWKQNALARGASKGSAGAQGFVGGVGGGLAMGGLAALAAGIAKGLGASRETEDQLRTLSLSASGSLETGQGAFRQMGMRGIGEKKYSAMGAMTYSQATPFAAQALGATRGVGGVEAVLRAQNVAGAGGQMSELMKSMSQGGAYLGMEGKDVDEATKRTWQNIFAAGISQGFKTGNVAEMIAVATAASSMRVVGTVLSKDSDNRIAMLMAHLGGSEAFKGANAIPIMQSIHQMVTGQGSPLSQAFALQAAGMGQGESYVGARIKAQQGVLGKGGGLGQFNKFMGGFRESFGEGSGDVQVQAMSIMSGLPEAAAKALLSLQGGGSLDEAKYNKILEDAKPAEQKAWDAMVKLGQWKSFDQALEEFGKTLGNIISQSGVITELTGVLRTLNSTIRSMPFMKGAIQTEATKGLGFSTEESQAFSTSATQTPSYAKHYLAAYRRARKSGDFVNLRAVELEANEAETQEALGIHIGAHGGAVSPVESPEQFEKRVPGAAGAPFVGKGTTHKLEVVIVQGDVTSSVTAVDLTAGKPAHVRSEVKRE